DAGGGMTAAAVSDRTEMTVLGSLGLIDRLELGIAVPMIVASGSAGAGALAPPSGTALGDIGVDARYVVFRGAGFALAAAAGVTLPTGNADEYAGTGGLGGDVGVIAGTGLGPVHLAANLAARFRAHAAEVGGTRQGTEIDFGIG